MAVVQVADLVPVLLVGAYRHHKGPTTVSTLERRPFQLAYKVNELCMAAGPTHTRPYLHAKQAIPFLHRAEAQQHVRSFTEAALQLLHDLGERHVLHADVIDRYQGISDLGRGSNERQTENGDASTITGGHM